MFFATREDLEPGIRRVEEQIEVMYIPDFQYPTSEYTVYHSALDIPNLGTTTFGAAFYPNYRIFLRDAKVNVNKINRYDGVTCYVVFAHENPLSLNFRPGGWYIGKNYPGEYLIGGAVSISENTLDEMMDTYHVFAKNLTRKFKVIKSPLNEKWRVGPQAYEALKRGVRLVTVRIDAPPSIDLQLTDDMK